jgi:HlyD family secretion protein
MQGADAGAVKGGSGGAGAGGQMNQFRERLITELKLDAEQQQRIEPIFAEMRNKFMGLRDLPEEARAKQGTAIRADMRARVEEVLKPEQKTRYAEMVTELGGRAGGGQASRGRIYLLENAKPRAIEIRIGLSDGAMSEVSGEGVTEGADVIIGQQGGTPSSAPAQKGSPPRMFF